MSILKRNYYCLVAGLPDLFFNEFKQEFNSLKFRNQLKHELDPLDFKLVEYLFLEFDNANLLNILYNQNKIFNCHAIYPKREIENKIDLQEGLPPYMVDFLKWRKEQDSKEFDLKAENKLHTLFYEYVLQVKNDFLRNWFQFELNTKNLITAINCNKFNYQTESQIILIESNIVVNTLLINNRLKHELFDEELPFSEQIFRVFESDLSLIEKEKALDKIKWNYLDENTFFHYFTIEKILSYVIKLIIAERWLKLDAKTGRVLLDKLIEELRTSYEFPAEFSLVK